MFIASFWISESEKKCSCIFIEIGIVVLECSETLHTCRWEKMRTSMWEKLEKLPQMDWNCACVSCFSFGRAHGMQVLQGRESHLRHSRTAASSSDDARSLTSGLPENARVFFLSTEMYLIYSALYPVYITVTQLYTYSADSFQL